MGALAVALICSSVAGDRLAKAKAQATALEFSAALGMARQALEAGDAEPGETAAIHAFTGELAAALGDRELARGEFARALTLNPGLDLPGASPRIREALVEAKKQITGKPFTLDARSVRLPDNAVSSTIVWANDPYSLATAGRLFVEFNGQWVAVTDVKRWTCVEPCRWWAAVVDRSGNQLARAGGPADPFTVPLAAAATTPVTVTDRPPWYRRAGPYFAAAAAVTAGAGVYFGASTAAQQSRLVAIEANRSMYTMAEAFALDQGRRRDFGLMWGALGFAVACAVLAVLTW